MRESIGGTWITTLVITFIFVFTAFLALSINYSKAFRVKNEVINFIEKYNGIYNNGKQANSVSLINNYLIKSGYSNDGRCPVGSYGINTNSQNYTLIKKGNRNKYSYCVKKISSSTANFRNRAYYEVTLFFDFNLPVMGNIFKYEVDGQSKDIIYPLDGTCNVKDNPPIKCYTGIE